MATAHNRKTRLDRLVWNALNCFWFKLPLQYRKAERDKKKDPRETKVHVDPKRPRASIVIHRKYNWSIDPQNTILKCL